MLVRRLYPGTLALLCCTLACDPRDPPPDDGDGLGEESESEGESTQGDTDSDSDSDGNGDDADQCPPQPELVPCESDVPCAEGFKCGEFEGFDCWGVPMEDAACIPVTGDRKAGESCTIIEEAATPTFTWRFDDCDAETRCLPFNMGSPEGICVPYCDIAENCADPARICETRVLSLCHQRCDPTAAESTCEGELACGRISTPDPDFFCSSTFFQPGQGQLGHECKHGFECASGLGCVDGELLPDCPDDAECCSPYCSVADEDSCAELGPDFTCLPYYEQGQAPATLGHIGQCVRL
jgi:hypothetical protein